MAATARSSRPTSTSVPSRWRRARTTARTGCLPARRCRARPSGRSATTARGPTTRTTSTTTSTGVSCAAFTSFAAWLNHDETRSINTLDTLVDDKGRQHRAPPSDRLRLDARQRQHRRSEAPAGNEYIWEARPTFITMLTFGLYVRPWIKVQYPDLPVIGRFEAAYFTPERWKPKYPNAAFDNMRPDDAFWAARRLVAFDDDLIRAAVKSGHFSDPEADAYLAQTLITRKQQDPAALVERRAPARGFRALA